MDLSVGAAPLDLTATMTLPFEYQNASLEFERFMVDARDLAGLSTTNMAWNMVVGVLHTFRKRLSIQEALRFADVLPPVRERYSSRAGAPQRLRRASGLRKNFWQRYVQSGMSTTSHRPTQLKRSLRRFVAMSMWSHSSGCSRASRRGRSSTGRATSPEVGMDVTAFSLRLRLGSNVRRLAARLHGDC